MSFNFFIGSLSGVQKAILKRQLAFKSLAIISLVATIISGIVAITMAFLGFGVWSLVAKTLVYGLINMVALWLFSDWRPSFHFSNKHFKELYSFGINIVGSNFVDFFSRNSDNFLIGYFLGTTALGYYTLAFSLLTVMTELMIAVPNAVLFPAFSRLQGTPTKMKDAFYEVIQLQSIVAFPIFLGMFAIAPEVLIFLYGQKWAPSIPVTQAFMLIGLLSSAFYLYGNVIKAAGKPSLRFRIMLLISILNVIGFTIAVRWGIVAVAASCVVVGYLVLPIYLLVVSNIIQVTFRKHLQQYIPALLSSLAMVVVIWGLKNVLGNEMGLSTQLIIYITMGALTYLLVLHFIQPLLYHQLIQLAQNTLPVSWKITKS